MGLTAAGPSFSFPDGPENSENFFPDFRTSVSVGRIGNVSSLCFWIKILVLGLTNDEDATNLIRLLFASVIKAIGEKIIPSTDNRKQYHSKAQREVTENNRKDKTRAMMKNYPQLLRKFMVDKARVSSLVEIIMFMKLELYSLKRQEQSFKAAVRLIKDAFFKHAERDALRSCIKSITYCASESKEELQDFSRGKLKDLEDELLEKLTSAIKEVKDGNDEYSLLVNLKRLYELQ